VINYIRQQLEQQHKGWIGLYQTLKRWIIQNSKK